MKPHKTSILTVEVKILILPKIRTLFSPLDLLMRDRKWHLCHLVDMRDILCPYLCHTQITPMGDSVCYS